MTQKGLYAGFDTDIVSMLHSDKGLPSMFFSVTTDGVNDVSITIGNTTWAIPSEDGVVKEAFPLLGYTETYTNTFSPHPDFQEDVKEYSIDWRDNSPTPFRQNRFETYRYKDATGGVLTIVSTRLELRVVRTDGTIDFRLFDSYNRKAEGGILDASGVPYTSNIEEWACLGLTYPPVCTYCSISATTPDEAPNFKYNDDLLNYTIPCTYFGETRIVTFSKGNNWPTGSAP